MMLRPTASAPRPCATPPQFPVLAAIPLSSNRISGPISTFARSAARTSACRRGTGSPCSPIPARSASSTAAWSPWTRSPSPPSAPTGLPYISILGHPTFGGVAASFAALGDVLVVEPGALVGFVGPRVIEQTIGERLPEDSHRAETLFASGLVDLLVERPRLRGTGGHLVG